MPALTRDEVLALIGRGESFWCNRTQELWSRPDQVPAQYTPGYCDVVAQPGPATLAQAQAITDAAMATLNAQITAAQQAATAAQTASATNAANLAAIQLAPGPKGDKGDTGNTGSAGTPGTPGTNATAAAASAYYTAAQTTIPSPAAGTVLLYVTYNGSANITDAMLARQTGLMQVAIINKSSTYALTVTGTFPNATLTTAQTINPGEAHTFTADPNNSSAWLLS